MNPAIATAALALLVAGVAWINLYFGIFLHRTDGLYYDLMMLVGVQFWRHRETLARTLQLWRLPRGLKFVLVAYGMVAAEEIVAALVNTINNGFSTQVLLERIPQFISFNAIVFTAHILVLLVARMRGWIGTAGALTFLGLWGVFVEHTYGYGPIELALMGLPVAAVYITIFAPALLSVPDTAPKRTVVIEATRMLAMFIGALALAVPLVGLTQYLRVAVPTIFPPCSEILC